MTSPAVPRSIAVVGGGITGLATAFALTAQLDDAVDITLFEGSASLGGKIRTLDFSGGQVEAGPDSFVAREPWLEDLCARLGLENELVEPAVFGAAVWVRGRLRRFPAPSLWGLPLTPGAALRADALSPPGRLRALRDLAVSRPLRGPDVSVRDFVTTRFGREVLERLVDPLLAGTKAGSVDEMSLAAALPQVDALARANGSIMRAGRQSAMPRPRFLALAGGMERLVTRLKASLKGRVNVRTGSPVASLAASNGGYELSLRDGERINVDGVALCVPAPAAARILRDAAPAAVSLLNDIEYAPVASVALRYPRRSFEVPEATSGVLVPRGEKTTISACTWWSTKWPQATPNEDVVVRCFVGRSSSDAIPSSDDELVEACAADVASITRGTARPQEAAVTRWPDGLPQYRVGHLARLDEVERILADHPRLVLAGASYRGSGLTDCVRQANEAAGRLTVPGPVGSKA